MAMPQPQNYPDDLGAFTTEIEKTYPGGWDKLDHAYQQRYMGHAIDDWNKYHRIRQDIKADTAAEFSASGETMSRLHPSKVPQMSKGGPETPEATMRPGPGGGGAGAAIASRFAGTPIGSSEPPRGEVEPAVGGANMRGWLMANVSQPMQRETVRGLAYMAANMSGQPAGPWVQKVMSDPQLYDQYKAVAQFMPIIGAGTPEGNAFDMVMLGLDPALKAAGITLPAMEGRKIVGPLVRAGIRTTVAGTAGAATEVPRALEEGSPMPLAVGAAKGVAAQGIVEGISGGLGLVGMGARGVARKAFQSDIIDSISGTGSYLKELLGNKLSSWTDVAREFLRTEPDAYNNARSRTEIATSNAIKSLEKRAHAQMAGSEFEITFPDPEMLEEKGIRKQMAGGVELKPQAATPERRIPGTKRERNPLWKPGPQAKGAPPKAPYWTRGHPEKVIPARPEIPPGTFRWDWGNAFQTMRNWERRGWGLFNDPENGKAAEVARSLGRFMRKELAAQADRVVQGSGSKWLTAKTQEELGHLWSNILNSEGVLGGLMRGDAEPLQRVVAGLPKKGSQAASSYMRDIIEIMDGDGSTNGKKLLSRVMHGGSITSPRDVTGKISPYVSGHMTGFRLGIHPTLPYGGYATRTQIDVGRGAWGLIGKMGATTFFKMIQQSLEDPAIDRPEALTGGTR